MPRRCGRCGKPISKNKAISDQLMTRGKPKGLCGACTEEADDLDRVPKVIQHRRSHSVKPGRRR